jgi:RNA polymerase sigma-70 factor, ECF subfamily
MTTEVALPVAVLPKAETSLAAPLDEVSFRAFYDDTARPLGRYLSRITGDARLAEDLIQESYCRFLESSPAALDPACRRSYLFRIATNLVHDAWRARKAETVPATDTLPDPRSETAERIAARSDLSAALLRLKLRERQLLWLAHVEGWSHREIATVLGLGEASIRPLLNKARHKLADLLTRRGFAPRRYEP